MQRAFLAVATCLFPTSSLLADGPVTMFASGDTMMVAQDGHGSLTGFAVDVFRCAMTNMNREHLVRSAPISRSAIIMAQPNNTVWFPTAMEGSEERRTRLVGPIGNLNVVWLTKKDYDIAPDSAEFKEKARTTAYSSSAMARWLEQENYNYVKGSADRNRVLSMIMADQVDAILSIDFRDSLPKDMQALAHEKLKATLYKAIPVGYQASPHLAANNPNFVNNFKKTLGDCL